MVNRYVLHVPLPRNYYQECLRCGEGHTTSTNTFPNITLLETVSSLFEAVEFYFHILRIGCPRRHLFILWLHHISHQPLGIV